MIRQSPGVLPSRSETLPALRRLVRRVAGFACLLASAVVSAAEPRPNILMIAVDDMRDWVGHLGGYGGKVHTPNIDRLASEGVAFTNAHCASPVCNPSRAAVMTGRMPSQTGVYDNSQWLAAARPDIMTLPAFLRSQGYTAAGAGKIFHHTAGSNPPLQWDAYHHLYFLKSTWMRGSKLNYPWSPVTKPPAGYPYSRVPALKDEFDWGTLPIADADYDDARTVDAAIAFLQREQAKPFLFACGIYRPHLPWYAPKEFFDLYPPEAIVLPPVKEDDLSDVPEIGRRWAKAGSEDGTKIAAAGATRRAIQAYLASISCADAQVGRVLSALARSPHAARTIVVLWSDHGWHFGEKGHWHKSTLWENATRVPFVVKAPGVTPAGRVSARPVNLIDVFPTLAALCGLEMPTGLSGADLTPLLRDPSAAWDRPSVTEYQEGNASVRSERYRLIRYRDGAEELYDHANDRHEWTNLASDPRHAAAKAELSRWLPTRWALPLPGKGAFTFDPDDYSWRAKSTGLTISARGPEAAMPKRQAPPRALATP
jgi:choline-sulfatase